MESDVVTMQDLFKFEQTGVDSQGHVIGEMRATGIRPTFADRFEKAGIDFDWGAFSRTLGKNRNTDRMREASRSRLRC